MQRREAAVGLRVELGAGLEQALGGVHLIPARRTVQRSPPVVRRCVQRSVAVWCV